MTPIAKDYVLTPSQDDGAAQQMDAVVAAIGGDLRCAAEPGTEIRRCFYDSFEWSLYLAGAALEEVTADGRRELLWQDLANDAAVLAREAVAAEPGLADELPPGPVRERLAPVLGVRRLLPMAVLVGTRRVLRVLNEDDKTVARILLEQLRVPADEAHGEVLLPLRLELTGVRGYPRELEDADLRLKALLALEPARAPLFLSALAAAGRRPGGYSSKLDYHLDPAQRADAATRTILRGLLDTLEANIDGTRRNLDPEFLHDLRVATRRTRSALGQIKGVLPQASVDAFKAHFAWLQQVTSPVRDLDVYLLAFPALKADLPVLLRDDLEPLKDWLLARYAAEQRILADALAGERFVALLKDWRAFLDAPSPNVADVGAKDAATPIKTVADKRVWRMFKRVRQEGRAITDASPPAELHELRKSCKKLRYLMEFFQSLYPDDDVKGLIKQAKVLLDNLGGFQDLSVQATHLRETAAAMQAEGAASLGTLLSMGALIGHMLDQQQQARRDFARIFAGFDTDENAAVFERLFARGRARPDEPESKPGEAGT
ncbi:MAG: CHAD domain-containing protein [Thiohalocapsa sp.]|uniref:CYTH and CHAD domain-containing protein n=1 Tax=Thiohalocapsa sp. TaxID=2497641 RepID=UPI0025F7C0AA|nr:CHAD domain-containing protein [Thiohalocapsa sp.]MCG6943358.1 CHAD domain-containing protein [Thiohalocapsa sp.]